MHEYRLILLVNAQQLLLDILIIWLVLVLEFANVIENIFYFLNVLSLVPQKSLWMLKTSLLNVFDFVHGVLFHFSPNELFLKEVKDHEVETPKIVSSGQVYVMMSI